MAGRQSLASAGTAPLMSGGARMAMLRDGRRFHLQHGPIDIVAEAFGEAAEVRAAYRQAGTCFAAILDALVAELDLLRCAACSSRPLLRGPVARRMWRAVRPYRARFITPMAAVASAVADEVLAAMDARVTLAAERPARGLATSGWRGRSQSLGIADAVTVLAPSAAAAAAATLVANAVNVEHPSVERAPASALCDDGDLGDRLVTVAVPPLPGDAVAAALEAGLEEARAMRGSGLIAAAYLALQGEVRAVPPASPGIVAAASS